MRRPAAVRRSFPVSRRTAAALVAVILFIAGAREARGWGYIAHRLVAEAAAQEVPEPLRTFLAARAGRLADLSLEPDTVLKPSDPDEGPRHFFELDALLVDPVRVGDLPGDLAAARRRFGDGRLKKAGVLPWWIADRQAALEKAMKGTDGDAVLRLAGHLSHYVADLHQPLHLTHNFDGQETGNQGVHASFERFLIERRPSSYRPDPNEAGAPPSARIADPARWALQRAADVFPSVRVLLDADAEAARAGKRNGDDYYRELGRMAGPLARRLLERSARATAELWTSAWIGAGRPDPARWRVREIAPAASGEPAESGPGSIPRVEVKRRE